MSGFSVVGQDKALRLLSRARRHGRLAHAYLFTGPKGCGGTGRRIQRLRAAAFVRPVARWQAAIIRTLP